jgi:O-antigen ligase/tetratricopeptide (TPR) repeat protein
VGRVQQRKQKQGGVEKALSPAKPTFQVDSLIFGAFIFLLLLVFSMSVNANFTIPKLFVLRTGAVAIFLLVLFRAYKGTLHLPPTSVLAAIFGMAFWFIFSTLFATHTYTALHGAYGRYNGLLNQLLYFGLCLSAASIPYSREGMEKIITAFIAAVVPVAIYALVQHLHLDPFSWPSSRPASTLGHPVMVAAIIGLAVPFSLYFLLLTTSLRKQIMHGAFLLLFLTASAVTLSRGPWVGTFVGGSIILTMYARIKGKQARKIIYFSLACLVAASILFVTITGVGEQLQQKIMTYGSLSSDSSFMYRLIYFKGAVNILKDHPVVGSGFETFRNLYPEYRPASDLFTNILPTMVHDGYLQLAQSTGLPGLALYFAFLVVVYRYCVTAVKKTLDSSEKLLLVAFIASLTGFLVQDLSGWLEISLTPLFWVLTGLALSACKWGTGEYIANPLVNKGALAASSLACIFALYLAGDAYVRWQADFSFRQASNVDPATGWTLMESRLLRAVELVPDEAFYLDQAGLMYYRRYAATGDADSYEKGKRMFDRGHSANPYDSYILLHAVELDGLALHRGLLKGPSPLVLSALDKLPVMDKNNTTVFETLAKFELGRKRFQLAENHINSARKLGRNQPAVEILAAELLREQRRYPEAFEIYRLVLQQLEKDHSYTAQWVHVRLSIATILFSQGKFGDVLDELSQVTARFPGEARAYIMQGDAWAALGAFDKARTSYGQALRIEPNNEFARRGLEQVKLLQGK